jgi:Rrf2 family protein
MLLSRACGYAIQAVVHIAKQPEGHYTLTREISEELGIPHHFLGKIVQTLVKAGILTSLRGPKGGLALSRSPEEITLMDVVISIDGKDFTSKCIVGLPRCDDAVPCLLHTPWEKLRKGILSEKSLASLLKEI